MNPFVYCGAIASLLILVSGCIRVPSQYQGKYEEKKGRYALTLTGSKAVFSGMNLALESKVKPATFQELTEPKTALYIASNGKKENTMQAYWLIPDLTTYQQAGEYAWYIAQVFMGEFNTSLVGKAPEWKVTYCLEGVLVLHSVSKTWQIGCSAQMKKLVFERTQRAR